MVIEGYPRSLRLRKRPEFLAVQRGGARLPARRLIVLWREGHERSRFGLVVSRKVGNAVTRNRVKRWLREAIRRGPSQDLPAVDVVVIARTSSREVGQRMLAKELWSALAKLPAVGS
jgi:ribonuclease P protein component